MEVTEIDGVKVVQEFTVLWHEWECDGYGWITEDGRAWLTTHGRRYEAKTGELLERMEAALSSAEGIRKALAMTAEVRENAATSEPEATEQTIGGEPENCSPEADAHSSGERTP